MSRLGNRRRLLTLAVALVAAVSLVGGALYARGASADITPYNAHPITVNPVYQLDSAVDESNVQPNVTFGCQLRPIGKVRCYNPQQIRAAYDIQPLLNQGIDGTGHTIVIVDAFQSPSIAHDLHLFDAVFGLPDPTFNMVAPDGLTPFNPTDPNMGGWAGEITLDVEWSHVVAPGAAIELVLAKSNSDADILSATSYAVNNDLGDVISQSFGEGESCVDPNLLAAEHHLFQQATAKKITLIASAGDQGAAQPTCNFDPNNPTYFLSASSPASDPLVLSVGGTQLNATFPGGTYQSEGAWNETSTFGSAGGGGFSNIYQRPGNQAPDTGISNTTRGVPDVAYGAAIDGGFITVWRCPPSAGGPCNGTSTFAFIFGGTSCGSPQWAGITVLANQMAGKRLGYLNTAIYHVAKGSSYSSAFHDITTGNNSFFSITGFSAGPGWDADTGVGTPDVANLIPLLIPGHTDTDGSGL